MLRFGFVVLLAIHGAIHLIGFVKAFELANVAQLKEPISRSLGVVWLLAGAAFIGGAVLFASSSRGWWIAVLPATAVSVFLIAKSWNDAKLGLVADVLVIMALAASLLDLRSSSFRSIYEREVGRRLAQLAPTVLLIEADLAHLPSVVQTYLRRAGVVGKPRVDHFRARWDGEMRAAPDAPWMSVRAEQHNFFTPPARLYLIRGARYGLPFEGLHIYSGANARMQIRLASIFDVADARGAKMDQSETVTLFNDMCLLAPATLIDPNIRWEVLDARSVRGIFTHAGHTISATLSFDEAGDLVSFTSGDRYLSADGETYLSFPWSTPVRGHRDYHGVRLAERGDAVWKQPSGDYVYARFRLLDVEYN